MKDDGNQKGIGDKVKKGFDAEKSFRGQNEPMPETFIFVRTKPFP